MRRTRRRASLSPLKGPSQELRVPVSEFVRLAADRPARSTVSHNTSYLPMFLTLIVRPSICEGFLTPLELFSTHTPPRVAYPPLCISLSSVDNEDVQFK